MPQNSYASPILTRILNKPRALSPSALIRPQRSAPEEVEPLNDTPSSKLKPVKKLRAPATPDSASIVKNNADIDNGESLENNRKSQTTRSPSASRAPGFYQPPKARLCGTDPTNTSFLNPVAK